jgi:hypothetical protein
VIAAAVCHPEGEFAAFSVLTDETPEPLFSVYLRESPPG